MNKAIISASILSADFSKLGEQVKKIIAAGVDYIHFDVMDGHFVPNLTFGAVVCEALRKAGISVPIDVHLMVENPTDFIEPFAKAGATIFTFHPETVSELEETILKVKKSEMQVGLAFNPDKPVNCSPEILKQLDLLLLMSVFPGFAGQEFIPDTLKKISDTRTLLKESQSKAFLGIDGGIKTDNIRAVSLAGADFFVMGSGLFHAKNYKKQLTEIRHQLTK